MANEAYIKAENGGKDFFFLFSLLDYEELPIVFIARDISWQLYLCDCTEFRFSIQKWTIASTTVEIIKQILDKKISIFSALMQDKLILAECDLQTDTFTQAEVSFDMIPVTRLPEHDSILLSICEDARNELLHFEIENAIRTATAFSSFSNVAGSNSDVFHDDLIEKKHQFSIRSDVESPPLSVFIPNDRDNSFDSNTERGKAA